MNDVLGRAIRDLRISVTDRCNFRCTYCMPFDEYVWIARNQVLSFEEITRLAGLFAELGTEKIRLTGGEPLVRRNLDLLIQSLSRVPGIRDISLTTNGALLAAQAQALRSAGLRRINVSLDTLRPDRFRQITQRGDLAPVLEGIEAAHAAGLRPVKINVVVIRGFNEDEIASLADFGREHGYEMRFIEYMDVGNANGWNLNQTVTKAEILKAVSAAFPVEEVGRDDARAPAVDYRYLDGKGEVGIIGSVTEPFCSTCTRARITADGRLVTCLFASAGVSLKDLLRDGRTDAEILDTIRTVWGARRDRFSEERWEILSSGTYDPEKHRKIEMITLGG